METGRVNRVRFQGRHSKVTSSNELDKMLPVPQEQVVDGRTQFCTPMDVGTTAILLSSFLLVVLEGQWNLLVDWSESMERFFAGDTRRSFSA